MVTMLTRSCHPCYPCPRVLESYPKNGKVLKLFGRFQEDVRNDFKAAARLYTEAMRQVR